MSRLLNRLAAVVLTASLVAGSIWPGSGTVQVKAAELDLTDGLVGYWTFEGTTETDRLVSKASVANVSAVKTGNGVILHESGGIDGNCAVSFSGDNTSYLTLNLVSASQGLSSSNAFTIGAWVKYAALPGGGNNTSVFHQEGDGNGNGRAILTIGSDGRYGTYLDATNRYCSQAVQKEEWHHVMMAVDASNASARKVYFYLDGKKTNEETFSAAFVNGSGNIRIGAHRLNADNDAVNGTMDEIRYYNKVVDADTVKAIYDLHGGIMEAQEVRESLNALIASAEGLNPTGTDTAAVNLKQAIQSAKDVRDDVSANVAAIEAVITELQTAVNAYEAGTPITIAVDTSEIVREIPSVMFGINHRYHNYGYGTWDKDNSRIYDQFNEFAKEAGFGSVRYPGGTISNLFTWKDSIGPKEDRTPTIGGNNFYGGEVAANDPAFGVDEAMTWIYDELGSEAIFVYGFGRGNSQDAADLVEYLNAPNDGSNPNGGMDWAAVRAENGHEEPYGVTRFEIGNEILEGGGGQEYWMSGTSQNGKGNVDLYIEGDRMAMSGQGSLNQQNNRVSKKGDWRPSASRGDGTANQERYVFYVPVVEDSATVTVGGTQWTIVDSLEDKGAENVCTFDYETGKIAFGDGMHGNKPDNGAEIRCNYQTDQAGFVTYYDAMKEVAEEIGMEIEIYSGLVHGKQNEFIEKMHAKEYDDKYDGVVIHSYSNGVSSYEGSLVSAKNFANNINSYKTKMDTTAGAGTNKKVALSEFGILSVSPASNYQSSLGHAIYIANEMIDCVNSGVAYMNKHCLVDTAGASDNLGNWQQCVIQTHGNEADGYQYVSTPSAHLFSIFNQMTGNHQVSETIAGNDVYTGSGASAVKNINVYSTKDDYGNTYVLVVNNKKESAAAVDITVTGKALAGKKIKIWSMTSENAEDVNTLAVPDKITVEKTEETAEDDSFVYILEPHSVYSFKIQADPVASDTIVETTEQTGGSVTGIPDEAVPGDEITITATPKKGYEFVGWFIEGQDEPVSTEADFKLIVGLYESALKAQFVPQKYNAVVKAEAGGTASGGVSGVSYHTSVTVTAAPAADYEFAGWYEGNVQISKSAVYTFQIQKNIELTAKFTLKQSAPTAPTGVKAKKTKKGIQISWKNVDGADGYMIYRSYKKTKGYKKIIEIKNAKTKKYLDKKAKKGKTAYYKIQSYKTINGKKVLSAAFSKTVKKKR